MKKLFHGLLLLGFTSSMALAAPVVVSPTNLQGWSTVNGPTGGAAFVNGPSIPPFGSGSVNFTGAITGAELFSGGSVLTNDYFGVALSGITALGYSTYVASAPTNFPFPILQLLIDSDNDGNQDDDLFFNPADNGTLTLNVWQNWDVLAGTLTDNLNGPPGFTGTLANYVALHPNARINNPSGSVTLFGLTLDASTIDSNVDGFIFHAPGFNEEVDFELTPAPEVGPEGAALPLSLVFYSLLLASTRARRKPGATQA